jgi:uncharacterized protein (DUF433 family)
MDPIVAKHIEKKPGVCGGKACITGTRIRVQDIYVWYELQGQGPDEIVTRFPQLTLADVHAALTYYWDNTAEIQQEIADAESLVQQMKQASPSPLQEKLRGTDASRHQVSS